MRSILISTMLLLAAGCTAPDASPDDTPDGSFASDLAFLQAHADVALLASADSSAQVALVPAMQGRVMTSTLGGPDGLSLGWINRTLIASGDTLQHFNPYGGEDRFWLGPEGGQFSLFFAPGDPFDLEHWFTPAPIDTEPFELVEAGPGHARLRASMHLENYSATPFDVAVERTVRLLDRGEAADVLGVDLTASVEMVGFVSENTIRNAGEAAWRPETGLLSVWILGMFTPSPTTTVVVPFVPGPADERGPVVNDAYFGEVPAERLVVQDSVLFFSGDGQYRSKIGLSPQRAKPILGSYDAVNNVLTLVHYTKPEGATAYVNSMWELQDDPYGGDVVNSYNDGPPAPGADPLGPFYELETSSPAAALAPARRSGTTTGPFIFGDPNPPSTRSRS